jgi:hypothetical protein
LADKHKDKLKIVDKVVGIVVDIDIAWEVVAVVVGKHLVVVEW